MHPTSFGQFWNCFNWGEFGVSVGAGALAGMAGYVGFGFVTSFLGTGFLVTLAAGAFSGVLAGQYRRFGQLLFSGNVSQAGNVLLHPGDMLIDAGLGMIGGAISFGFGSLAGNLRSEPTQTNPMSQLPSRINNLDKTSGILIADNSTFPLESGWNGPASSMPPNSSGFDIVTRTHVEGHASALMHQNGWNSATLYINNPPCPSCTRLLPRMLPPNATLQIIGPNNYINFFIGLFK